MVCILTVTTASDRLASRIEPRAPSPSLRLKALEGLSRRGIFAGVALMPVLPFLEDNVENVLSVVDAASDAGARFVYPAFAVSLRDRQRDYYYEQLDQNFPGVREKYERRYGERYWCTSPAAKELWAAFTERCEERGLLWEMDHIVHAARLGVDGQMTRV